MQSDFDFRSVIVRADFPGDLGVAMTGTDCDDQEHAHGGGGHRTGQPRAGADGDALQGDGDHQGAPVDLGEMILRATAGAMIGEVAKRMRAQLEAA